MSQSNQVEPISKPRPGADQSAPLESSRMRGVLLTGHGGLDKLVFREDLPLPVPREGEVLVRVLACALNNTDINMRVGWYGASVSSGLTVAASLDGIEREAGEPGSWDRESVQFPRIQGAAVAGEIVKVGAGIAPTRIGSRVLIDPVIRDMRLKRWARGVQYLGSERDGGFADYVAAPDANVLNAPPLASPLELACLPCAFQTAEEMQLRARVSVGDRVLVTGASGGVGLANVLLAKLRGAKVIAIASRTKAEAVLQHGADVVVARDSDDFAADLKRSTGYRGVDVVLDVVGGELTKVLWHSLDRAGRYVTSGAIGGAQAVVDLRELIYKDLEMYGVTFPEAEALQNLIRYIAEGQLKPVIDQVFPLRALAEAQAQFATRRHVGKIVIDMITG